MNEDCYKNILGLNPTVNYSLTLSLAPIFNYEMMKLMCYLIAYLGLNFKFYGKLKSIFYTILYRFDIGTTKYYNPKVKLSYAEERIFNTIE